MGTNWQGGGHHFTLGSQLSVSLIRGFPLSVAAPWGGREGLCPPVSPSVEHKNTLLVHILSGESKTKTLNTYKLY